MTDDQTALERAHASVNELALQVQDLEMWNKRLMEERSQLLAIRSTLHKKLTECEQRELNLLVEKGALRVALGVLHRMLEATMDTLDHAISTHTLSLDTLTGLAANIRTTLSPTVEERKLLGRLFAQQPEQESDLPDDSERRGDPSCDSGGGGGVSSGT